MYKYNKTQMGLCQNYKRIFLLTIYIYLVGSKVSNFENHKSGKSPHPIGYSSHQGDRDRDRQGQKGEDRERKTK